jgi:hypothetical protein
VGTYALWSDSVAVNDNQFTAGEMVLKVGGQDAIDPGCDIKDMYPGQTVVIGQYPVANAGDAPGTLSVGVLNATGDSALRDKLNYTIEFWNVSTSAWEWAASGTLKSLSTADANLGTLGIGASKDFKFSVSLDSSAGNDTQGKSVQLDALWKLEQQ